MIGGLASLHSSGSAAARPACRQQQRTAGGSRGRRGRRGFVPAAAAGKGEPDPYSVLQVARGASRRQIRAAYIEQIKQLHPDVSVSGEESTAEAAALNAAYEAVMQGYGSNSRDDNEEGEEWDPLSVFDQPEAEPDRLFVNPFACYGVSPLQWEDLQAAGRRAEASGRDPWSELQRQGVRCSESALVYLSPQQLELIEGELTRACAAMDLTSLEVAEFFVADCLLRARMGNSRMPAAGRR